MQGEIDGVHVFAAEGRIHDGGRERMGYGISSNTIDAGGGIDRLDAVEAAQLLRGGLAGSSFFSGTGRGEGEDTAGADSEHAANEALLPHAQANQRMSVGFAAQELNHGNVIGKSGGGADHFVEVGREGAHLFQSFVGFFGAPKVVKGENKS